MARSGAFPSQENDAKPVIRQNGGSAVSGHGRGDNLETGVRAIGGILTWGFFYALAALAILFLLDEKQRADNPPAIGSPPALEAPTAPPEPELSPPAAAEPSAPVSCQFGKRGGGGECAAETPASPRPVRPVRIPRP